MDPVKEVIKRTRNVSQKDKDLASWKATCVVNGRNLYENKFKDFNKIMKNGMYHRVKKNRFSMDDIFYPLKENYFARFLENFADTYRRTYLESKKLGINLSGLPKELNYLEIQN